LGLLRRPALSAMSAGFLPMTKGIASRLCPDEIVGNYKVDEVFENVVPGGLAWCCTILKGRTRKFGDKECWDGQDKSESRAKAKLHS
jgi:hypothetical protein